jgi:hypothetical protein
MKIILLLSVLVISGCVLFLRWYNTPPAPDSYKTANITIGQETYTVDIASTFKQLKVGLSGRSHLEEKQGMLFVFGSSRILRFWMKDMEFALDVLWIKDDKIIGISKNVLPPSKAGKTLTMQSPAHVDKALELNAGVTDSYDIKVGDTVVVQER